MRSSPEISVVIPAYNEEGRLEPTVREASQYFRARGTLAEIIVVDDGSRDGTSTLVRRLMGELEELKLIRLAANRGKGYAVRSGVLNAIGRHVLFADADGSTPMAEVARLESALSQGACVAIGSRALAQEGVAVKARFYRRLIGRAFHALVSTLTVKGITDTQCGFKMLTREVAHDLFARMRMNGFSFDVELLLMAQRGGYRIDEIPVNWTHRAGSKVSLIFDSLRMAYDLFVIRSQAMRGLYDEPHLAKVELPTQGLHDSSNVVARLVSTAL
jgi:dolichyl-phosphate beta-glucosyltransferase